MTIQDIAFCIPTYNRPEECQDTINRLVAMWPDASVYVADDSEQPGDFWNACDTFHLPPDSGVSKKRNHLVEQTDEPFIFMLDDDMKVDHVNLDVLMTILDNEPGLGLVAVRKLDKGRNRWANSEGNFFLNGNKLHINRPVQKCRTGLLDWMAVDYAPMCFLARRGIFRHVNFDERLKTCGEHVDFFLKLAGARGHPQMGERLAAVTTGRKKNDLPCGWVDHDMVDDAVGLGVAIDPSSYVVDTGSRPAKLYNGKRARGGRFRKQMMARWCFTSIVRWNSRVKAKAIYG